MFPPPRCSDIPRIKTATARVRTAADNRRLKFVATTEDEEEEECGGACAQEVGFKKNKTTTTIEQNATVQEGMFIHLMLRANLCLVNQSKKKKNEK